MYRKLEVLTIIRCTTSGSSAEPPLATRPTASASKRHITDPLLQQIPNPLRPVAHELKR